MSPSIRCDCLAPRQRSKMVMPRSILSRWCAPAISKYTAVHIKVGDKWLMSTVRELRVENAVGLCKGCRSRLAHRHVECGGAWCEDRFGLSLGGEQELRRANLYGDESRSHHHIGRAAHRL